jgi:hypothetical protein
VQEHPGEQHLHIDLQALRRGEQHRELKAAVAVVHQEPRRAGLQQCLHRPGELGLRRVRQVDAGHHTIVQVTAAQHQWQEGQSWVISCQDGPGQSVPALRDRRGIERRGNLKERRGNLKG